MVTLPLLPSFLLIIALCGAWFTYRTWSYLIWEAHHQNNNWIIAFQCSIVLATVDCLGLSIYLFTKV
jgi:hypothetical protein